MEPIKLEFIVKGDIENDLARVKLAIKGVGDESYTSFKRLLNSSNESFNELNKGAQQQAVALQRVINEIRQNEAAQEALYEKLKKGTISSNEYAIAQSRLSVQQADLKQQAGEMNQMLVQEIQNNRRVVGSLDERRSTLRQLKADYAALTKEERENAQIGGVMLQRIRVLNRELSNSSAGMREVKAASGDLTGALEQIPGPIGDGVSQFRQLITAGKTFMGSGIGIFISGLTALFYGLKWAIEGSEQATVKLNAKQEYFKSIFATHKQMLTEGAALLYNLVTGDTAAADKNNQTLLRLQTNQVAYAKMAEVAAENQNGINKLQERNNGLVIANTSAIEQQRAQLMDVNKTFEERKKIGESILKLEKENATLKLEPIAKNYANFTLDASREMGEVLQQYPKQLELANQYFATLAAGGELTLGQQYDMINAINDITAGSDRMGDNNKKLFREFFTDALNVNKEYYNRTREVSTNLSNIIKAQANETAKENKKTAFEKLEEEVRLRKEQYELLYAFERNMGKEAASEAFADLKAQGSDFVAFLSGKITELQNKPGRKPEDNAMLGWLFKQRDESQQKFDTSAFKQGIAEKKQLYQEDLDAYITYLQKMEQVLKADQSGDSAQKRMIISAEIESTKQDQQKELEKLLSNYQSFTTRMVSLEKSYQADMNKLGNAYKSATTDAESKRYDEAMSARTDAYNTELATMMAENSSFTEVLFGDLDRISRQTLKKAINEAKEFIEQWKEAVGELSPEMAQLLAQIETGIEQADNELSNRIVVDFQAVAQGLQDCADMADAFGSSLSDVVQVAADVAQAGASIAGGIAQISSGNIAQGAAGIVSGIAGFFAGIGKRLQENKRVLEDFLLLSYESYSKEIAYNSMLRERLRITQQIGETSLDYFERLRKELALQKDSVNKEYQEVWAKLMGEEYISDTKYKHGTWFRKAKTWNEYSSLSGMNYEQIESLYTQDKLDGAAKILFERLKALKEEGADVVDMMDSLKTEMQEAFTGTTSTAILDSISQGFLNGKRSAADYADYFRDLMRNAMMASIQMKYLEAPLQEWYARFADASESGLTQDKIDDLKAQYDKIIESAAKEAEALEKLTGVSLAQDATREAVAKGIQSVSQDSFSEFMGSVNALTYITYNMDKNITDIQSLLYQAAAKWVEIEENTRYCRRLEGIEKDMKGMRSDINQLVNKGIIIRKG